VSDESPARQLVGIVWRGAPRRSWRHLNGTLKSAVHLAISAGLKFAADDFEHFFNSKHGRFWFSEDHESFYAAAVQHNNTAACRSWEKFVGRPPVILDGNRLYIGAQMDPKYLPQDKVDGRFAVVTSFSLTDRASLIVCQYGKGVHAPGQLLAAAIGTALAPAKPTRKFRLTFDEIRAGERARVKAAKAEKEVAHVR